MSRLTSFIWYEKYRPTSIGELSLDKNHKAAFDDFISKGEIPHLLLSGIQGSGKTTTAFILMKAVPSVSITLNASGQDRNIETMRNKVRMFASSSAPAGKIKIVFLDEADAILPAAQEALKNTIEACSSNCRFIFTCNNVDKIIAPIQSRCMAFTFERFPKRRVVALCESILAKENIVEFTREDVTEIVSRFYPDIRSVVNNLQSACLTGVLNLKALGALKVDPSEVGELIKQGRIQSIRQHLAGTSSFMFMYKWLYNEFMENYTSQEQGDMVNILKDAISLEPTIPDRELNFIDCCVGIMGVIGAEPDFFK